MKPTFAKLGLKLENNFKTVSINNQEIEVKQYLPINDKLDLIAAVINLAADDNNFMNPVKMSVFMKLEIVFRYTNISFTEKQKEDLVKLYDLMSENGVFDVIISAIPDSEYNVIFEGVMECSKAIYEYQNSMMGILERVNNDYINTNLDLDMLSSKINNLGDIGLLQDVITKLG